MLPPRLHPLLLVLATLALTGCPGIGPGMGEPGQTGIHFRVTVPENTPPGTVVHVFIRNRLPIPLEETGPQTHEVFVPTDAGQTTHYAYARGTHGYMAAERFTPEAGPEDWTTRRSVTAGENGPTETDDTVAQWRWLPAPGEAIPPPPPSTAATAEFPPRVDGWSFIGGVGMSDYWSHEFREVTPDAIARLTTTQKATWVQVFPNAHLVGDPAQGTATLSYFPPGQYDEDSLRWQTRQFRAAGLKVAYSIGVANYNLAQLSDLTLSEKAWDALYAQFRGYLGKLAQIAQEEGASMIAFHLAGMLPGEGNAPASNEARMRALVASIRAAYTGKISYEMGWNADFDELLPFTAFARVADLFDAVGGVMWDKVAETATPTDEELRAHLAAQMDRLIKPVWEKLGKPFYISQMAYPSIEGAFLGSRLFPADDRRVAIDAPDNPDYKMDLTAQARIFEAILAECAARPYVIGTFLFGQPYWMSVDKNYGVWGKPAEQTLAGWFLRAAR